MLFISRTFASIIWLRMSASLRSSHITLIFMPDRIECLAIVHAMFARLDSISKTLVAAADPLDDDVFSDRVIPAPVLLQ